MKEPILISGHVKHYPWGKLGSDSIVAKLAGKELAFKDQPCAELWFGAHSAGPSTVLDQAKGNLNKLVSEQADKILGLKVQERYGNNLPYLFKVLSIASPLSIQLHPTKEQALELHRKDPLNYPDLNHKPELAIAISEVELLHGVRPIGEILLWISLVPELNELLGLIDQANISIKEVFARLYATSAENIYLACAKLKARLEQSEDLVMEEKWALRMASEFPQGDKGVFAFFLLNYARLMPYEGVFTPAGVPHAYLSGDLFECMANSDNVVRAGLTHKFCDGQTMLEIMDYSSKSFPPMKPANKDAECCYQTEAEEFALSLYLEHSGRLDIAMSGGPELGFIYQGQAVFNGQVLTAGQALLVPAKIKSFQVDLIECTFLHTTCPNSL